MASPSDRPRPEEALQGFADTLKCPLCHQALNNPHKFSKGCGHIFCHACVIATLEGPGITKSECPLCHMPAWKNDLVFCHKSNNLLQPIMELQRRHSSTREAGRAAAGPAGPAAAAVAAAAAPAGRTAAPTTAPAAAPRQRPQSNTGGGGSSAKRRRGRSVPELEAEVGKEQLDRQQAMQHPPVDQQQLPVEQGGGWQQRQPQHKWRRHKAGSAKKAGRQGRQRQGRQQLAAAASSDDEELAEGSAPETPLPVLYDSDWEERMLALPPPSLEELAALEEEAALLRQAIQLCDELPCLGGSKQRAPQQPQQCAAAAGSAEQADQVQPPHTQQHAAAAAAEEDVVVVPDTEEQSPSPQHSAQQQDEQQLVRQSQEVQQAQQQFALPQMTQEIEDSRLSGRKRRKGAWGRAAAPSRPATSAGATAATASDAHKEPPQQQPSPAQQQQPSPAQQQQQQQQQQQPVPLQCPPKASVRAGDAVEVMWEEAGRLQPYTGIVVRVDEAKREGHEIEYLDGDSAWHDLDEEQWRPLQQHVYDALVVTHRASGGSASGGSPPIEAAAAAALAPAAAARAPSAAAAGQADPYQFVSNTETLLQSPQPQQQQQKRQEQQQHKPALQRRRPLLPPPKFHQAPQQQAQQPQLRDESQVPSWLAARPAASAERSQHAQQQGSAAATASPLHFSRKRKGPASSGGGAAAAEPEQPLLPPPQQQVHPAQPEPMQQVPCTQDAVSALFYMQQQRQPTAAHGGSSTTAALPLQPTSKHNTVGMAGSGGAGSDFVPASQLLQDSDELGAPPSELASSPNSGSKAAATGARQRSSSAMLQEPSIAAAEGRSGRKLLQDPGLFSPSSQLAAAAGSAGSGGQQGQARPPGFGDLFAGATASETSWPSSADSQLEGAELEGLGGGTVPAVGGRRTLVIGGSTVEMQRKAHTLLGQLGCGVLEENVTERTTHVLMAVDKYGCVKQRSMQYLLALAHGCWVLSYGWVDACLEAGAWVPERGYEIKGQADLQESRLVPAAARQRHIAMAAGGPGLFAGRRVFILAPAAGRPAIASKPPGMVHRVGQMVAAEGGTLARSLRSAAHGEGRGAASPSPSPEGGTLLLCVASSLDEAKAAIKAAQKRYPGRLLHHHKWVMDSLSVGRSLHPADYEMAPDRPIPPGVRLATASQQGGTQG